MAIIGYCTVGSNDLEKAKAFYDELLGSIGWKGVMEHQTGGRVYSDGTAMFGVLGPFDGSVATVGNGTMISFKFDTPEEAGAFYDKAISLGATDEGVFSERQPGVHFGYFRDLDGNKLCCFKFGGF